MRPIRVRLHRRAATNETLSCCQSSIDNSICINNSENQHRTGVADLDTASPVFSFYTVCHHLSNLFMRNSFTLIHRSQALVVANKKSFASMRRVLLHCLIVALFVMMGGK